MTIDSAVQSAPPLNSSLKPSLQPLGDAAEHVVPAHSHLASASSPSFADLDLPDPLLRAVTDEGYTQPTPIQALTIPLLLQGRDVIGQAQTGTGKTAAFSLPLLQHINPQLQSVQALVLVPTRELALQVATAVHTYAKYLPRITVLPIFGGDSMDRQMTRLGRGIHVVVGTPGRILDHLRRGSLDLSHVGFMVLDEADEMLRMGFLEDVETILAKTPATRQTTLLSATLPSEIRRVARNHLRNPEHVAVAASAMTVASTRQCVAIVPENLKQEAVARILETEEPEAALIFTRTRIGADQLAEQLTNRGFPAEALHSDLSQAQRLTVLQRLRDRRAQVVVATDVAARGLDIDHISHVINYDLPAEAETYVHRIGRTGRAGRAGLAVLLATPFQRPVLRNIERFIQRPLELLNLPTLADVSRRRRERLKAGLLAAAAKEGLAGYRELCAEAAAAGERDPLDIAAAALRLLTCDRPLFADGKAYDPLARLAQSGRPDPRDRDRDRDRDRGPSSFDRDRDRGPASFDRDRDRDRGPASFDRDRDRGPASFRSSRPGNDAPPASRDSRGPRRDAPRPAQSDLARVVLAVGHRHGIRPGDIVGAIANEAGLSGRDIGRVEIRDNDSVVEIPSASMQQVLASMQNATLRGEAARPRALTDSGPEPTGERERPPRPRAVPDAPPPAERERPPRPSTLIDSLPDLEHERAERPRPIPVASPAIERERPARPRPFSDSAPSAERERPARPRPFNDAPPSAERERPPRPRPFSDAAPTAERERSPRPRPFNDAPLSAERERPPRPRPFNDAAPTAERGRVPLPYVQRTESRPRPSDGPSAYHRPPPPPRGGATSWTWGNSAPSSAPTHSGRSDSPPPPSPGRGESPPKRRPH